MRRVAIGYVRRSSVSADNPGEASREVQEQAIARLAGAFSPGEEVVVHIDWGISGGRDDRPGYVAMKQAIESGDVSAVYAYSLSRLGRRAAELDAFFTLCKVHDVRVTTQAEGALSATTAMGQFLLQVMSAMAQLERELAKERTGAARLARKARHDAAGLPLPSSMPPYGWRNVTEGGLTRVVRDESVNLQVIADTYEEARSVRGAAVLLNSRNVPAPRGGLWNLTPLRRVLERLADEGRVTMPERNRKQRHEPRTSALFAGLLLCHCGRRLTPNVTRGQYYCAAARSNSEHGRMSTTEKALLAQLQPEADEYLRTIHLEQRTAGDDLAKKREVIERRQAALDARLDVDRITPDAYREATRALHQELADLHRDAAVSKTLRLEQVPPWSDLEAMNRHLRRIWTKVQLDPDMTPTAYWRDSRWRYDPEQQLREEAELRDAEAAGLMVLPLARKVG